MSNKPCPFCSQGFLSEKKKRFLFSYNGRKYWIPDVKVEVCNTCDEEIIEAKEIRRMEKIAKEKFENQYTDRFFTRAMADNIFGISELCVSKAWAKRSEAGYAVLSDVD